MRIILLALLASLNVTGCGGGSSSSSGNGDTALVNAESNGESSGEVCSDVETLSSGNYDSVIAKWKTLDQIERRGPARMVAVGSSSIRYWRSLFPNFSEWDIIQRGFGGSLIWDSAQHFQSLITDHDPSLVLVFAGTNDVARERTAEQTINGVKCLIQRLESVNPELPIIYIAITPTPARWNIWDKSNAVNLEIEKLASEKSNLFFMKTAPEFLETGEPPSADLFWSDGLHLSDKGYAIWNDILAETLTEVNTSPPTLEESTFKSGDSIFMDFGPSNAEDGEQSALQEDGTFWNNWHNIDGEETIYPGEHLSNLINQDGESTSVRLITRSDMSTNGKLNGGLMSPSVSDLGELAVSSATVDYLFGYKLPGAITINGLRPDAKYSLKIFSSRADSEERITRFYIPQGNETIFKDIQTSGLADTLSGGNEKNLLEFQNVTADKGGAIHLDMVPIKGDFTYLNAFVLTRVD